MVNDGLFIILGAVVIFAGWVSERIKAHGLGNDDA